MSSYLDGRSHLRREDLGFFLFPLGAFLASREGFEVESDAFAASGLS